MKNTEFSITKIVTTLGPATKSHNKIKELVAQGVRNFRINFSHGSFDDHAKLVKNIRKVEKESEVFLSVIGDLTGPKIRISNLDQKGVDVVKGQKVLFAIDEDQTRNPKDNLIITSTMPSFIGEVKFGENILIDDGNVKLKCVETASETSKTGLLCEVLIGGKISKGKGINLPETELSLEAITEKDIKCIEFAIEHEFDYLALSFVRRAADIKKLKERLIIPGKAPGIFYSSTDIRSIEEGNLIRKHSIPVITKIEKPQAIQNLEEIVKESDAVMVARGDLGVEMNLSEVAILQKKIIKLCQSYGRPVIVATQMLESMIKNPVPTRAEVSDVANAILDGADAVMLSGETAVGKYPIETVSRMNEIARQTNQYIKANQLHPSAGIEKPDLSYRASAIAKGVEVISRNIDPELLLLWTNLGGSAVYLSQRKLPLPIIAFNNDIVRLRQLSLLYGIIPVQLDQPKSGSQFIETIDKLLLENKWAKKGDGAVILSGDPINRRGFANRIVLHYIGESFD